MTTNKTNVRTAQMKSASPFAEVESQAAIVKSNFAIRSIIDNTFPKVKLFIAEDILTEHKLYLNHDLQTHEEHTLYRQKTLPGALIRPSLRRTKGSLLIEGQVVQTGFYSRLRRFGQDNLLLKDSPLQDKIVGLI